MNPTFKARWNQAVGYARPDIITYDQMQDILKQRNQTAYVKYVTVNGHIHFAHVVQIAEGDDLTVLLCVAVGQQSTNLWKFQLDNLPAMSSWDTIELKGMNDEAIKAANFSTDNPVDDFLPCPKEYLQAISSQEDQNGQPEGW